MLLKVDRLIEKGTAKIEMVLTYIGVGMLLIMVLLGTADVIGRYVFNTPIKGTWEISKLLMGGAIFMSWGYVQATKSNISLDLVITRYPPRIKLIVEIIILILTLVLFVFIGWQSFKIAMQDLNNGALIENIYISVFPFKLLITFGAILVCLESIIQIAHLINDMTKKRG
jgi:TRAP-type C4-dicarboxylate transport system permease small subunit